MKTKLLTTIMYFVFFSMFAQYDQFGQDILGESRNNLLGASLSMNSIGNRIGIFSAFVDGDDRGQVKVFEYNNGSWELIGSPILGLPSFDGQGAGMVQLNNQGDRVIFSSPFSSSNSLESSGTVRVFELQNNEWIQVGQDLSGSEADDLFGYSVDINAIGDIIIIGAREFNINSREGYVRTYSLQGNTWTQMNQQLDGALDESGFGNAVSIDASGTRIAILAEGDSNNNTVNGYIQVFESQSNSWVQLGNNIVGEFPEDSLGTTLTIGQNPLDLTDDGNIVAFGGSRSTDDVGYVKVEQFQEDSWVSRGTTVIENSSNTSFGLSVSINNDGNLMVVGSPFTTNSGQGMISIYDYANDVWQKSVPNILGPESNGNFGFANAMNSAGSTLVSSAPLFDGNDFGLGLVRSYGAEPTLSVNTVDALKDIRLYPNPNAGSFKIQFPTFISKINITVSNTIGQNVYSKSYQNKKDISINQIFTPGLYIVTIQYDGIAQPIKLIVN